MTIVKAAGKLPKQVLVVKARLLASCQSKDYWSKQGLLVKARTTGQSKDYWSKQGLLVKARTTGQSKDYWSKQGLLVKARTYSGTTRQRQVVKTCPTCPR